MPDARRTSASRRCVPLLAVAAAGCGLLGSGETQAPPVEVTVQASDRLNPDETGQSLPTLIRIFLLKSQGKAEAADFDDLYRRPKEALGEDLVQMDEIVLSPGDTGVRRLAGDKAARALLVMGVFRRPMAGAWRSVTLLPPGKVVRLAFRAEEYRIDRR